MRDYDMATPEVVLKDGEYRMKLDLLVGTDDEVADAFEAAADVIRRIQGTAGARVAETDSLYFRDQLRYMAEAWSWSHPRAAKVCNDLADWLHRGDVTDFTPPADADAIAAAKRRAAQWR